MTQTTIPQSTQTVERIQALRQEILERDFSARAFLFILLHIPLVVLFRWNPIFPTIHALATLGLGLLFLVQDRTPKRVVYITAYITGAELLWRGTDATVFYEFGKYACILLLVLGLLKFHLIEKMTKWPLGYFALLIPSILILPEFDREAISFNLAGPLALAVAVMFFSRLSLDKDHLRRVLLALIGPAVGLGFLAALGIFEAEVIQFADASNFETSAGIGPNQISSMMGLGAMAAILLILLEQNKTWLRTVLFLVALWLMGQTMLTFSRGGFWNAILALAVAGFYLFPQPRTRSAFVLTALLIFSVGYFFIFPALDDFTGSALQNRFQDLDTTGRVEIIQADLIAFRENPYFGVGPHQSKQYHALTFRYSSAHTEYSRLLAEHGLLGLAALLIFVFQMSSRFIRKGTPWQKSLITSFTMWGVLFMLHAATRLMAPSFLIGLASAHFLMDDSAPLLSHVPFLAKRNLPGFNHHE